MIDMHTSKRTSKCTDIGHLGTSMVSMVALRPILEASERHGGAASKINEANPAAEGVSQARPAKASKSPGTGQEAKGPRKVTTGRSDRQLILILILIPVAGNW